MYRKLTTDAEADEVRPFAVLQPQQATPVMETVTIAAGEIVQLSAEDDRSEYVRVGWQGRVWTIDRADWNLAETVTR